MAAGSGDSFDAHKASFKKNLKSPICKGLFFTMITIPQGFCCGGF
jgi:hypothetical protein